MIPVPVIPRTLEELAKMANPQPVEGGQSEALYWELYDTDTYVDVNTTQLSFFNTARANLRLSNSTGRGLPTPQYFELYYVHLDILQVPGNLDTWGDHWRLINGTGVIGQGAPTWTWDLANKQTGPFPLRGLKSLGGINGFSTRTANEYANNGNPGGMTFNFDGAMVIPPNQSFFIQLDWPAFVNIAASTDLQITLCGVLHRRVL